MRLTTPERDRLERRRLAIKKLYKRTFKKEPHYNSYLADLWLQLRSKYPEDKQYKPDRGLGVILDKLVQQMEQAEEVD